MARKTVTLVQMARLGDLAQSWLLITKYLNSGFSVRLVVEERLKPLADLMVGGENACGVDTFHLRRLAREGALMMALKELYSRLGSVASDNVINLNHHPAVAAVAEAIPASNRAGARWRDVGANRPSDALFQELFRSSSGKSRLTGRHLSEIWGDYGPRAGIYSPLKIPDILTEKAKYIVGVGEAPVAIVVGAGHVGRAPGGAYWTDFIRELPAGRRIILVGGSAESPIAGQIISSSGSTDRRIISLCGETDPAQLAAVLSICGLVVGTDTGPLHVAAMLGVPCFGVYYGSMFYRQTGPYGNENHVMVPESDAYPCPEEELASFPGRHTPPPPSLLATAADSILNNRVIFGAAGWRVMRSSMEKSGIHWVSADRHASRSIKTDQKVTGRWTRTSVNTI